MKKIFFILLLFPIALLGQSDSIKSFHIVKPEHCIPIIAGKYRTGDTIPSASLYSGTFLKLSCSQLITRYLLEYSTNGATFHSYQNSSSAAPAIYNCVNLKTSGTYQRFSISQIYYIDSNGNSQILDCKISFLLHIK